MKHSPRQSRVVFAGSSDRGQPVEVTGDHPRIALFQDLLGMMPWSWLSLLAQCAARQVGYGHELASISYDDEPEPDQEPFEGVCLTADFRDEYLVLSRQELDAVLADFFEMVISCAPEQDERGWLDFVENARRVAARTARPLG